MTVMLHDYMTAESDTQNQCKKRYTFNKHGCVPKIQFFSLKKYYLSKDQAQLSKEV